MASLSVPDSHTSDPGLKTEVKNMQNADINFLFQGYTYLTRKVIFIFFPIRKYALFFFSWFMFPPTTKVFSHFAENTQKTNLNFLL